MLPSTSRYIRNRCHQWMDSGKMYWETFFPCLSTVLLEVKNITLDFKNRSHSFTCPLADVESFFSSFLFSLSLSRSSKSQLLRSYTSKEGKESKWKCSLLLSHNKDLKKERECNILNIQHPSSSCQSEQFPFPL